MNTLQRGLWSGIMANGPMTLSLFKFFESLPSQDQTALPPAQLTAEMTKPLQKHLPKAPRSDLTLLSHYGYSAACGILYAYLRNSIPGKKPTTKGMVFGLGVWAASYMGWIPAMGLRTSAYRLSRWRNLMMIGSHLIWGSGLAMSENKLRRFGHHMLDAKNSINSRGERR